MLKGDAGGAAADFFCMNAAAALFISGMADNFRIGADMARQALESGAAFRKLEELRIFQGTVVCLPA